MEKNRKTCKLCAAPIDAGFGRGVDRKQTLENCWHFDKKECLDILSVCCVNCFHGIVSLQDEVPRIPHPGWRPDRRNGSKQERDARKQEHEKKLEQYRAEDKEHLRRCAARYASSILRNEERKKAKQRGNVIAIYPPADGQRELLMLELVDDISGFLYWRSIGNRDITDLVRRYGTAAFWSASAHWRHLRRTIGIKGVVCKRYQYPEREEGRLRLFRNGDLNTQFRNWRETIKDVGEIERKLLLGKMDPISDALRAMSGYYVCVWERVYEDAHFREFAPLKTRLKYYRRAKRECNRE